MRIAFQRDALYEEVWNTPMTTLAKRYGLSDNGLRKICFALNVPLPKVGHWMKVEAGKAPSKPKLPSTSDRTTFVSTQASNPAEPSFEIPDDAVWLKTQFKLERQPERAIDVVQKPKNWHPAVAPLHDWLKKCAEEYHVALRKKIQHDKKVKSRGKNFWDPNFYSWDFNRHHPVLGSTHKAMAMRVSIDTYERALAILNAIAVAAEKRGFAVELGENRVRLYLSMESARTSISIVEQASATNEDSSNPNDPEQSTRKPGPLCLNVGRYVGDAHPIKETDDTPLEGMLNIVFEKAYRHVVRSRVRDREWNYAALRDAEARRVKEEQERLHQEQVDSEAREKTRRDTLVKQSNDLVQAARIRSLIAHMEKMRSDETPPQAFADWKRWAQEIADETDPSARLLARFGEPEDEDSCDDSTEESD